MNEKIISIIICALVLAVGFSLARGSEIKNTIIYVDDDNTQGPWDGTMEHPYQFIQHGIDVAGEGDTVYVFSGTYTEMFFYDIHIRVNKSINLYGEDKYSTIIDGENKGTCLYIKADQVHLSGFTLQHAGPVNPPVGFNAAIVCTSENVSITDTIIKDNIFLGINLQYGKNNIVSGNIIQNNTGYAGILLLFGIGHSITNNSIINNRHGIVAGGNNCSISRNSICKNYIGVISSCELGNMFVDHNTFKRNVIHAYFGQVGPNTTSWNNNYWGRPRILPKILVGITVDDEGKQRLCMNIDKHPALLQPV